MTYTDEQVERVARALARKARVSEMEANGFNFIHLNEYVDACWADHKDRARAAIAAMGAALPPQVSPELIEKLGKLANYLTEQGEYEACDLIDTVVERATKPARAQQGDGLAELRELLDEYDRANGETKYTPSKQRPYAMTLDGLSRQTFAAMYAYVRAKIERTKGTGQ